MRFRLPYVGLSLYERISEINCLLHGNATFTYIMNCKVCQNLSAKNPSLSFFRFPSDYDRCREWARRCSILHIFDKYGPGKFYKSFRICSNHFESKYIAFDGRKKKLLNCAVPKESAKKARSGRIRYVPRTSQSESDYTFKLMKNLCRFCAEEHNQLIDIYGWRGKVLGLEEKLKLLPITVDKNDKLPLKICSQCAMKIGKFYDFVKNCLRADVRLKTILGITEYNKFEKSTRRRRKLKLEDIGIVDREKLISLCRKSKPIFETVSNQDEYFNDSNLSEDLQEPDVLKSNLSSMQNDPSPDNQHLNQDDHDLEKFRCDEEEIVYLNNAVELSTVEEICPYEESTELVPTENPVDIFDENNVVQNKYACNHCFKTFDDLEILELHEKAHFLEPDEHGRFICQTCNREFRNEYRLNEHNRIHTGEYPFECIVCDMKFHKMALLKQHSQVHESKKPFVCTVCNLRCSRKGNLLQHLKTHYVILKNDGSDSKTNNPTISVQSDLPECEKKGDSLSENLSTQNVLIDKEASIGNSGNEDNSNSFFVKLVCKPCRARFLSSESLKTNSIIHTSEISKYSSSQKGVEIHDDNAGRETSNGEKFSKSCRKRKENDRSYRCEECGATFKRKDTLKNHIRIHTGERPFMCKICGFTFKQRGDCLKHERNHKTDD